MIDPDQLEEVEEQVKGHVELRAFVEESLVAAAAKDAAARGEGKAVTRTGVEVAALWSLGLATLLVLRRLGLFGGSRRAQAADTSEASRKIAEAVEALTAAGFEKSQAIATVRSMYEHAAEREENTGLIKALAGQT